MQDPIRAGIASLFADDPMMAFELAERCGLRPPGPIAEVRSAPRRLVDPLDPARHLDADLLLLACDDDGSPREALVVEVLTSCDAERLASWDLVDRAVLVCYGCPGRVFIVSPIPEVRAWASEQLSGPALLN